MLQQGSCPGPVTPPAANSNNNSNMFPQQYCLRWKYHHNNLQTMFTQLLERQAYCDVTLACEGKTLRVHKVVLCSCSTYFDSILSQYEEKDPIVIMRDVKFSDIKVLVEFMYKGEINIEHTRLSSLLKTAEDLHIKGLAEVSWRSDSTQNDLSNSGHSPGSGPPGVETVLREGGEPDEPPPPKQRRRGRPPLDDPPSAHDVFTPKITCITGNVGTDCTLSVSKQEEMSEGDQSWDDDMMVPESNEAPMPILSYMPKDDSMSDQEKKAQRLSANTATNSNAMNPQVPEQFRDVIKMNDYLTTGRRQEFWEEPFTRRVMDAIKSKELEMKTAAEILGVSYGTLYGRYRDSYGCLKHPYRVRDFWSEPGPAEILAKLRRKEITLFRAAEFLNVTVHTLATYLSTLQGPDRISLAGDLSVAAAGAVVPMDVTGNSEIDNNESMNDILQKINANVTGGAVVTAAAPATSATIKREGGSYCELPALGVVPKAASSVLDNNPDITIVKTEGMQRKRVEYTKLTATENNNAKLMSGGAVSELGQPQIHPSLLGQQSQQSQPQQQMVTAQTTVQQQLQQQQLQHHQQQHQQKLADTLSINNDISKP
ncbi:modifier of mdg4 isoform X3 [Nasonia vitripennis]|uniref:BTB domain-containing protein n=1 Tax=Nasonia vitripennis TaxID=7425 RepID=A0A7M7R2C3_NASVI|nr:modifier of mdg4 isoform X3 [Nasonia vitripennis]